MTCPRCHKTPEEHEAGRETDACIAKVVMGYEEPFGDAWLRHYSTRIADADDIMKKWENEGRLYYLRRSGKKFKIYLGKPNEIDAVYSAEGDTKEIAICRAALMASKEE